MSLKGGKGTRSAEFDRFRSRRAAHHHIYTQITKTETSKGTASSLLNKVPLGNCDKCGESADIKTSDVCVCGDCWDEFIDTLDEVNIMDFKFETIVTLLNTFLDKDEEVDTETEISDSD